MVNKRKHHIVPRCYLKNFSAADGNIWTYRLDNPNEPFSTNYENVGHIRDYYAQPKPDGTTDHNLLENFFDESVERNWSSLFELIADKEHLNHDQIGNFLMFVLLQRIRVPATRDMIEVCLAYMVKNQAKLLESDGKFDTPPSAISSNGKIDWDKIDITIDPHQSLHGMAHVMQGMSDIIDSIGYYVFENKTDLPFITSDNPVCYYTPTKNKEFRPYTLKSSDSPVELVFPLSSNMVLIGQSKMIEDFSSNGIGYAEMNDVEQVRSVNDTVARFAYQHVYASDQGSADLIAEHADIAPVTRFTSLPVANASYQLFETVFGKRPRKPKWEKVV